jgi:hypothetical protein
MQPVSDIDKSLVQHQSTSTTIQNTQPHNLLFNLPQCPTQQHSSAAQQAPKAVH